MSKGYTTQTGKLTRRNHPSLDAARWELVQHGYYPLHIRPDERRERQGRCRRACRVAERWLP